jgi:PPM family protein phosphatase
MSRVALVTAFTHQGAVRQRNEDAVAVGTWLRSAPMPEPRQWRRELNGTLVCAVADGMGGHAAGDIASRLAVQRLSEAAPSVASAGDAAELLCDVNARIYAAMDEDTSTRRMGTTVAALFLTPASVVWCNVGDSRVYSDHNGSLQQLSRDDVPTQASAVPGGPRRVSHEIVQSLGGMPTFRAIDPHAAGAELTVPSRWLLCSDGLTDMVDDEGMDACMAAGDRDAVKALFRAALRGGGQDNVSIIVVSVVDDAGRPSRGAGLYGNFT